MVKLRNSKNRELDWSDIPQNSNFGREFVQKSRVQIPVGEGQFLIVSPRTILRTRKKQVLPISKSDLNKRYPLLCEEFEKEKKQEQNFLTFRSGDLNPGFLNKFPPKIWILREIRFIEPGVLRTSGLYRHCMYFHLYLTHICIWEQGWG